MRDFLCPVCRQPRYPRRYFTKIYLHCSRCAALTPIGRVKITVTEKFKMYRKQRGMLSPHEACEKIKSMGYDIPEERLINIINNKAISHRIRKCVVLTDYDFDYLLFYLRLKGYKNDTSKG